MLGVWDWVSVGMLVMGWWVIRVGTKGGGARRHMCLEYYTLEVSLFFFLCLVYYYTIPEQQQYEALLIIIFTYWIQASLPTKKVIYIIVGYTEHGAEDD